MNLIFQKQTDCCFRKTKRYFLSFIYIFSYNFLFKIRRMQDMLTQMQEKLKATAQESKKHDSIIDV